jgi:TolB-like protein/Tfp pilus assembly protein PilF
MSFIEELKRRNVFRVGIAYAVASWVLLQLVDVVGDIIEMPDWMGKFILMAVVVCFVPVLIFAWAFELTPEGLKREKDVDRTRSITHHTASKLNTVTLVLMTIAIGYLLLDKFYLADRAMQPAIAEPVVELVEQAETPTETEIKAVSRQSIAVLPFDNRSRNEEDEFFVEGVHDDLLTNLARIGSLKVISRTSVGQYAGTTKSIPDIARELGVATVMEGAVQRSGDTVRINVQLIDAQTDEHLWAEIFDRELTADNLFAIQSEISEEIAKALKATLSPEEERRINERPTENLAAYNAYLRGRQLMARRNSTDIDQAAAELRRAVELDPQFALAWTSLSEAATLQVSYSTLSQPESLRIRQDAIARALAIDNQLGEAHLGQAGLYSYYQQFEQADASYRKAIEFSPGYYLAYMWYSGFLNDFPERRNEALAMVDKAIELDPLSSIARAERIGTLMGLGRYAEAEAGINALLEFDPEFPAAFRLMSYLKNQTGQFDEAVRWLMKSAELDPGRMNTQLDLMWAYLDLDYIKGVALVKTEMEALDSQHVALGMADMMTAVHQRNYDSALESARWSYNAMGQPPWFQGILGYINVLRGDNAAAMEDLRRAKPEYFDRSTWRKAMQNALDDSCIISWLITVNGDAEMGTDLARTAISYMTEELPQYIDHADRYGGTACYLVLGDVDNALATIETHMSPEHRHYGGWWFLRRSPTFEPLWGDPRFETVMANVEAEMTLQRQRVEEMQASGVF